MENWLGGLCCHIQMSLISMWCEEIWTISLQIPCKQCHCVHKVSFPLWQCSRISCTLSGKHSCAYHDYTWCLHIIVTLLLHLCFGCKLKCVLLWFRKGSFPLYYSLFKQQCKLALDGCIHLYIPPRLRMYLFNTLVSAELSWCLQLRANYSGDVSGLLRYTQAPSLSKHTHPL